MTTFSKILYFFMLLALSTGCESVEQFIPAPIDNRIVYFRLKQVPFSGKATYSETVTASITEGSVARIAAMPCNCRQSFENKAATVANGVHISVRGTSTIIEIKTSVTANGTNYNSTHSSLYLPNVLGGYTEYFPTYNAEHQANVYVIPTVIATTTYGIAHGVRWTIPAVSNTVNPPCSEFATTVVGEGDKKLEFIYLGDDSWKIRLLEPLTQIGDRYCTNGQEITVQTMIGTIAEIIIKTPITVDYPYIIIDNIRYEYRNYSALPITIASFHVHVDQTTGVYQVELQTASEVDMSHFEIERSYDTKQWDSVGVIKASNNSKGQHYSQTLK